MRERTGKRKREREERTGKAEKIEKNENGTDMEKGRELEGRMVGIEYLRSSVICVQ